MAFPGAGKVVTRTLFIHICFFLDTPDGAATELHYVALRWFNQVAALAASAAR